MRNLTYFHLSKCFPVTLTAIVHFTSCFLVFKKLWGSQCARVRNHPAQLPVQKPQTAIFFALVLTPSDIYHLKTIAQSTKNTGPVVELQHKKKGPSVRGVTEIYEQEGVKPPSLTGNEWVDSVRGYLAPLGRGMSATQESWQLNNHSLILLVLECRNRRPQFPALCSDRVVPTVFLSLCLIQRPAAFSIWATTRMTGMQQQLNMSVNILLDAS